MFYFRFVFESFHIKSFHNSHIIWRNKGESGTGGSSQEPGVRNWSQEPPAEESGTSKEAVGEPGVGNLTRELEKRNEMAETGRAKRDGRNDWGGLGRIGADWGGLWRIGADCGKLGRITISSCASYVSGAFN